MSEFVVYRSDNRPFQIKGRGDNAVRVLGALDEAGNFHAMVARPATPEEVDMYDLLQQQGVIAEAQQFQLEVASAKLDVALANAPELAGAEGVQRSRRLDELVADTARKASR